MSKAWRSRSLPVVASITILAACQPHSTLREGRMLGDAFAEEVSRLAEPETGRGVRAVGGGDRLEATRENVVECTSRNFVAVKQSEPRDAIPALVLDRCEEMLRAYEQELKNARAGVDYDAPTVANGIRHRLAYEMRASLDPTGESNNWHFLIDSDRDIERLDVLNPSEIIPVIVAPGSLGTIGQVDPCLSPIEPPATLKVLSGQIIVGKRVTIYYYCNVKEIPRDRDGADQSSAGMIDLAKAMTRSGVPSRHIFLLGQSPGGWSVLLAARKNFGYFNGVIVATPGNYDRRKRALLNAHQLRDIAKQTDELASAKRLNALVYMRTYDGPRQPGDLDFLCDNNMPGVRCVEIPNGGHSTFIHSQRFARAQLGTLRGYISESILHSRPL